MKFLRDWAVELPDLVKSLIANRKKLSPRNPLRISLQKLEKISMKRNFSVVTSLDATNVDCLVIGVNVDLAKVKNLCGPSAGPEGKV
jgi:hypothetical protein